MKEIKTFFCQVDCYRNGAIFRDIKNRLYNRQTKGTYYVGAKTSKEAKKILQDRIGFGSICVSKHQSFDGRPSLKYKEIIRRDGEKVIFATDKK